jgi:hypothetical protein
MALQSVIKISAVFEVLIVVIKDRSSIFLPKAVNFFWTTHCHTPVDSGPHNDVHFQDTYLHSVGYLVTYEVCTAT